jgi:tRNA 2-selenouridine synthase
MLHPSKIKKITEILTPELLDAYTIIDVRTPAEFAEDAIPGASNLPVLDDAERAEVGTIHKQISAFRAREVGARLISRNISSYLDSISEISSHNDKPFLIYCWRGGLRSRSLFTIMNMIGYRVFLLEGGYKAYRREVWEALEDEKREFPHRIISIHGYTGSAKTELLDLLEREPLPVIDLEGAARHRGSLLGSIGPQPSQKLFETKIYTQMMRSNVGYYIVEGESRKIGNISIPGNLWNAMRNGVKIWVDLPRDVRVQNLVRIYTNEIGNIIEKLPVFKGHLSDTRLNDLRIQLESGNLAEAAEIFLIDYYDPLYRKHGPEHNPDRYDLILRPGSTNELYELTRQYIKTKIDCIP